MRVVPFPKVIEGRLSEELLATLRQAIRAEGERVAQAPGWLDVDGAAVYLSTTPAAIRARVRRRELPSRRLGGSVLFKPEEIDRCVRGEL